MNKIRQRKLDAIAAINALYSTEPDAFLLLDENNISLSFMTGNNEKYKEEREEEKHKEHEESETSKEEEDEHKDGCSKEIEEKIKALMMDFLALKEKVELLKTGITNVEVIEPLDDIFAALETAAHHCTDILENCFSDEV